MAYKVFLLMTSLLVFCDARYYRNPYRRQDNTRQISTLYATCSLTPDPNAPYTISGTVSFQQVAARGPLQISVSISGFDTSDSSALHGFHVHEYGDIAGGCGGAGGHYNPSGSQHGAPGDSVRHAGDFGNIVEDANGDVNIQFTDSVATLTGANSIYGRAIVVHAGVDDLGQGGDAASLANGNAGSRLACCVIAHAPAP